MLYHGSRVFFPTLKRKQAWGADVPDLECLNAIYFTPDFGFALLCAARPEGVTEVDHEGRTVHFEGKFDPAREVYVYYVAPSRIPESKRVWVDPLQIAAMIDEISPDGVERHLAGEICQYYSIIGE